MTVERIQLPFFLQSNMGAKNHAIVMPDASEDASLNAIVAAGFGAAGQRCMALSTVVFVGGAKSWYGKLIPLQMLPFYENVLFYEKTVQRDLFLTSMHFV